MNYETRLKQMDAQRSAVENRFDKATQKAQKQATFAAGEMLLNCIAAGGGDWRGIKWEKLDDYFSRKSTQQKWHEWFTTEDFETGEPGKRLKEFKAK